MEFLMRLSSDFVSYLSPTKVVVKGEVVCGNYGENETLGSKRKRAPSSDDYERRKKSLKYCSSEEVESERNTSGSREQCDEDLLDQTDLLLRVKGLSPPWTGRSSSAAEEILESIEYEHTEDDPEDDEESEDSEEMNDEDEDEDAQANEISENPFDNDEHASLPDRHSSRLYSTHSSHNLAPVLRPGVRGPADLGRDDLTTEALIAKCWSQDSITLLHRIVLRGYEPLLPAYMKFEYRCLPDELFVSNSASAFLTAASTASSFRFGKELDRLMEISSRTRDSINLSSFLDETCHGEDWPEPQPELVVKKYLGRFYSFLLDDAGLSREDTIPLLTMTFGVGNISSKELRAAATRKCAKIASRWHEALRDRAPKNPSGRKGTVKHPMPTIYSIACSWTVVVLFKYDPLQDDEPPNLRKTINDRNAVVGTETRPRPECESMAIFDLGISDNDVWDALALACVGCHVRNVLLRIARETGIGYAPERGGTELVEMKSNDAFEDDPDA